jgi:hypothetical protein
MDVAADVTAAAIVVRIKSNHGEKSRLRPACGKEVPRASRLREKSGAGGTPRATPAAATPYFQAFVLHLSE